MSTVSVGVAVFGLGIHFGDFWGLLLMIVGLVPTIIGAAGISLLGEIRDERALRREQQMVGRRPSEAPPFAVDTIRSGRPGGRGSEAWMSNAAAKLTATTTTTEVLFDEPTSGLDSIRRSRFSSE